MDALGWNARSRTTSRALSHWWAELGYRALVTVRMGALLTESTSRPNQAGFLGVTAEP